jgi:hypothetical protein
MGIVTTTCPRTGKQVSTGVNLDRGAFRMLPANRHFTFHCWLCGHEHEWTTRWARLVEERDPALADALRHTQ